MKLFRTRKDTPAPIDLTTLTVCRFDSSTAVNRFDCGRVSLDRFIKNKNNAKKLEKRYQERVYVARQPGSTECVGYYSIRLGSDSTPASSTDYIQNHAVFPSVHISHVAVDAKYQRQKVGYFLLMDAFEKVADIAEIAGFYALTLQAIDADTAEFYAKIGFTTYVEGDQPKMLYPLVNLLKVVGRA